MTVGWYLTGWFTAIQFYRSGKFKRSNDKLQSNFAYTVHGQWHLHIYVVTYSCYLPILEFSYELFCGAMDVRIRALIIKLIRRSSLIRSIKLVRTDFGLSTWAGRTTVPLIVLLRKESWRWSLSRNPATMFELWAGSTERLATTEGSMEKSFLWSF